MRPKLLLLLLLFSAPVTASATYYPPPEDAGGWRSSCSTLGHLRLGVNPAAVKELLAYSTSLDGTSGTIIIKDGWIIGERYKRSKDRKKLHYVASVGKNFSLACFGIMVEDSRRGRLPWKIDNNAKLYDRRWLKIGFPLSDPRKAEITFDMVFQHTAGFLSESLSISTGRNKWHNYAAWLTGYSFKFPRTNTLEYPPGKPEVSAHRQYWGRHCGVYSSLGFAHISEVLREVYQVPADRFLKERLLEPIGIRRFAFHRSPAAPERMWFSGGGLRLTTRDLARLGWLYLNKGKWRQTRLFPADWLEEMIATGNYPNLLSNRDGYFGRDLPPTLYRMFGSGLNFVFILPEHNLVVVRTSHTDDKELHKIESEMAEITARIPQQQSRN